MKSSLSRTTRLTHISLGDQHFEPCGEIDAVIVNVVLVDNHVAKIYTDAEL